MRSIPSVEAVGRCRSRVRSYAVAVEPAEIQYAKSGDLHVAYQVLGDGPIDLLALDNGSTIWIDRDDEPHWTRFDRRLLSFSRLIRFDPSGRGLSDPLAGGAAPTIKGRVQDAVLDAVRSSRAACSVWRRAASSP